jgi:hypothetical protein
MIICHSRQVNFWKIPRTGSTTVEALIRILGVLDYSQDVTAEGTFFPGRSNNVPPTVPPSINGSPGPTRTHLTPTEAIQYGVLTQQQYDTYQNFCMVRNPVERLLSAHTLGFNDVLLRGRMNDFIADHVNGNMQFSVFKKQVEWLAEGNITALPFSDYETSVRTILAAFGVDPLPGEIPSITRRHPRHDLATRQSLLPADEDAVRLWWPEDEALNY